MCTTCKHMTIPTDVNLNRMTEIIVIIIMIIVINQIDRHISAPYTIIIIIIRYCKGSGHICANVLTVNNYGRMHVMHFGAFVALNGDMVIGINDLRISYIVIICALTYNRPVCRNDI